jgi:hypothetical protein
MTKRTMLVAACLTVAAGSNRLAGDQPLRLSVSPAVAIAPTWISVRAMIEANDDNRFLEIIAQSSEYTRSSTIELDGRHAPRVTVFDYRDLPAGRYEVSGWLVGVHGTRATATQIVRVIER